MARFQRYRKYSKRRTGKHWSTRLVNFQGSQSATAGSNYIIYQNLCQNPAQNVDTISNLYTVKNINCQIELETDTNSAVGSVIIENLQAYVMYIPQGYIPTGTPSAYADLPFDHPEWIMAHRFYGSASVESEVSNHPLTPGFPPIRLRSRLSRKLDTGDRVVVVILGINSSASTSATLNYRGLVKYNTKAN